MPLIKCKCGCGAEFEDKDKYGRNRMFAHGHNTIKTKYDQFWGKVKKFKENECWIWVGAKDPNGYGSFRNRNKLYYAHRFSFQIHNNDFFLDKEDQICHKCDNPSCVNPQHLFKGKSKDNFWDAVNKGRLLRDEFSGRLCSPEIKNVNML